MKRVPVYQMVFARSANSTLGLAFNAEADTSDASRSTLPLFVIPRIPSLGTGLEYYFPGELNGQYTDYSLDFEDDETSLVISDPRLKYQVHFSFHSFDQAFVYLGKRDDIVEQHTHFYILKPLDRLIMDKLYQEQGVCFSGLKAS
ncbi:hypothetical protein [Mucilaginibacter sp. PPCGB 2223]|uniref:hypothetical protein n=1 Tax=Mucilaginibacter sp. PPCGB 2223 TaxID=1886027 RepID=UPI000825BE7E|nr:hypothetical protein [Mucilaginibacter sp. PPCGB 2223]